MWELWPYLTAGASVHVAGEPFRSDPEALRDWLLAQEITISFMPTAMAEGVIALQWPVIAPLRFVLTGGDRLHSYPRPGLLFKLIDQQLWADRMYCRGNIGSCPIDSGFSQPPEHWLTMAI